MYSVIRHNIRQLLIAADQLVHVLLCMLIMPNKVVYADETLSSHAWRWYVAGICKWPCRMINILFFWDTDHCRNSFESERMGRQLPPELRQK